MYVPPELIAKAGVESLALVNSIIKISENLRKDKTTSKGIADIISQLETDAFVLSGQFIKEIEVWEQKLRKVGIDLDDKFVDLEKTGVFWTNRHDKAIDAFESYLAYFQARLSGFMDDLIAVARCAGKAEILALSSQQAAELKQTMRKEADVNTRSIKEILAVLRGHAEHFRGVLGTKK